MSEWSTYRLADFLLFSPETYYRLFELHNNAVWPAPLVAALTGLAILALTLFHPRWAGRAVAALLAAAWIFVGCAFLLLRYADINFAATYFAWAFFAQAALLVLSGVVFARLQPSPSDACFARKIGLGIIAFALLVYAFVGALAGRKWSEVELFGIAPDPTVLLTLGVLLTARRMPWELTIIPALWCIVTGATLWVMDDPAAIIVPAAALLTVGVAATKRWHPRAG